jgi:hypothetical protein
MASLRNRSPAFSTRRPAVETRPAMMMRAASSQLLASPR